MKKKILLVTTCLLFSAPLLSACNPSGTPSSSNTPTSEPTSETPTSEAPSSETSKVESPYSIKITAIGSTTIRVSQTLQLRSSVTGTTQKDVTWSSSDETLATVSSNGLVTALSAGEVEIKATLDIDHNCEETIKIKIEPAVAPTNLEIKGYSDLTQWVGESLALSVDVTPSEASSLVDYDSSNKTVATVTDAGLVSFLAAGSVTITATSKEDTSITASVTFNVKNGIFRSDVGSPYWNLEHQADDTNAYIDIDDKTPSGYHSAYFSHVLSTKYYAEATFKITKQLTDWVWQGVGIGSGLSETDTRYYLFSPRVNGQGNNHNKTIVKDLPNETWPAITVRSQVWGENDLNYIDWENGTIKMGMVRNGNEHYYLINDRVMWYDNSTKYEDIPTMPILCAIDVAAKVTDYKVTTDTNEVDAMLNKAEFKKSFFPANTDNCTYTDDSSFTFNVTNTLSKDHKVRSIGDKAKLVGNFEVEFDVSDLIFNGAHTKGFTGMTCNFSRYDAADTIESFMVGKSAVQSHGNIVSRFASWNHVLSMDDPAAVNSYLETSATAFDNPVATHHIKITRTVENNLSTFRMWVDGNECNFDVKSSQYVTMDSRYTGAYLIWVGGEYTSGAISNFTFSSKVA